MDDPITVGHPFYFPTQVIMVDDDADFLEGISLMLDKDCSYRLFQSASEALDCVNQSHQQATLLQRCYSNYKTGPLDSDSLSHVDIGKLHEEIYNPARFQTSSTVVVDYSMPEMNGLEFLMSLKNPFIRKILLTGKADMELAIKAFNKQMIDQYIDKHDPRLKQTLNSAITSFRDQYFRSSYKLLTDPIIASNHDAFLTDTAFQEFFRDICKNNGTVEYYMIDFPHAGYLMVDALGKRRCMIVYTEQALAEHVEWLEQIQAPEALVSEARRGECLPGFDTSREDLDADADCIKNWKSHYHPALRITSGRVFLVTVLKEGTMPDGYLGNIIPYADFLESNSLNREILH